MREKEKQQGERFPCSEWLWGQAKDLWTGGVPSRTFSPVPANDPQGRYRRQVRPTPSYWQRCLAWLRYQSIQMRWDVERRLARMLHRRWGVKER